ncbi:MAG: alpha/beta hydrolase [Candidatus Hodarchaeales archaeon]|jgi:acetyl esterase/lipase
MSILDKSRIRPDILQVMDDIEKIRAQFRIEFFKKEKNQGINFPALWKKVMAGNARSLKGEEVQHDYLSPEEQLFLAKLHRAGMEYRANFLQKHVFPIPEEVKCEQVDAGSVSAEWQTVPGAKEDRVLLYFHGGGYIMGSPNTHRPLTIQLGKATKMRVLSVDYRLAPEAPYPAGLEDCTAVYNWLLSHDIKSKNIVIAGDSAGGYFTLMTLVRLRNDGASLPGGAVVLSPATDLASTSESFIKNAPADPVLAPLGIWWWPETYLAGVNPLDPLASPVYADLTGLPPILIQVSTSEMLFNDATRFAERAKAVGVDITLQTWDNTLHVFQAFGLPESEEAITKIAEFVQKQIS